MPNPEMTYEILRTIRALHVRRALSEQVYRSDLIAEKIRNLIVDGTLRIQLSEPVVGSVHGLLVALKEHSPMPAATTASSWSRESDTPQDPRPPMPGRPSIR